MTKQTFSTVIFILLFYGLSYSQNSLSIKGRIFDSRSNKPIEYVNIGIFQKNIGTVSNSEGVFEIKIPGKYLNDSLTFSSIGYKTKRVYISDLENDKMINILLVPKTIRLSEVKIISNKLTQKIKGNKAEGNIGLAISESMGYGSEIGTLIKLPNKSVILKDFNFHINYNRPDSAKFRLKIYSYNKSIDTLITNKNIIFTIKNHYTGNYKINLRKYNIVVQNDIFVSIECLAEYTNGYDPAKKDDNYFYDRL